MEIVTVKKLKELCNAQIAKGNGDKQIVISNDDEGNGFHSLFFHFTADKNVVKDYANWGMFHDDNDPEKTIILG